MVYFKILVLCSLLTCIQANTQKYLDSLPKCALKDQECLKNLYQHIVQSIGETGIPELDIPAVDPIELKNVTISILGMLDITMVKGIATGVKTCVFDIFTVDLVNGSGYQENTCSIKIEGKYKLRSNSPLIKNLFGSSSVHGDGNGKASLDKVHLTFNFPNYAQKRSNGEIYMNVDYKNIVYDYEVQGGAKFFADNIYLGDMEVSKIIMPLLNQNWKYVMRSFGRPFVDKAMEYYFDFAGKFFNVVPTRYYIIDDLTPYARP